MNRLYGSGIIEVLRAFQRQFAGLQKGVYGSCHSAVGPIQYEDAGFGIFSLAKEFG